MSLFSKIKSKVKASKALSSLSKAIAGSTGIGRTVNAVTSATKPKSSGSSSNITPIQPSGLNYTPAYQTIAPTSKNTPWSGPQTLLPSQSSSFKYSGPMTPLPKTSTDKSTVLPSGSRSSKSGGSQSGPSAVYGVALGTPSSRSGASNSYNPSASMSSGSGSMFGGAVGAGSKTKSGGDLNVPLGGSVLGSTDFDYNLTPQQLAEKEAREQLEAYAKKQANQDVNEEDIYRNTLRQFQGEIDATNQIVAEKLRQAQLQGQSRLGSTRAENFNAGAVDSSFGNAAQDRVVKDNQAIESGIMAEKLQAIAQIENQARELGNTYYQQRKEAKEAGLSDYLDVIKNTGTAKEAIAADIAMSIFNSGVTVDEIKPVTLSKIAKNAGITVQQVKNSFANVLKEMEAEADTPSGFSLSKDETRYEFNPVTGQYETVGSGVSGTPEEDTAIAQAKQNTLAQADNGLNALGQIAENDAINMGGFARKQAARISGTSAYNLKKAITTLQALLSFSALQEMRDASKTGGALGQVSERELDLLGSTVANLDIGLSPEILIQNLQTIEQTFNKLKQGASIDLQGGFSADPSQGDADFDF